VQYLFVDEISMASADLFDALVSLIELVRELFPENGTTLVCIGDPNQLPPANSGDMMYKARAFERCGVILLEGSLRLRSERDPIAGLISVVNNAEKVTAAHPAVTFLLELIRNTELLCERNGGQVPDEGDMLYAVVRNKDAESINNAKHQALAGPAMSYQAVDVNPNERLLRFVVFETHIELKVGELVMCRWNINVPAGLVNGAVGRVVAMSKDSVTVAFMVPSRRGPKAKHFELTRVTAEVKDVLTGMLVSCQVLGLRLYCAVCAD
jgi:AAA domain